LQVFCLHKTAQINRSGQGEISNGKISNHYKKPVFIISYRCHYCKKIGWHRVSPQ